MKRLFLSFFFALSTAFGIASAQNDVTVTGVGQALSPGAAITSVYAASSANVSTLAGLPTVDSVSVPAGQIVLLSGQTNSLQNGPWQVSSGGWTRPYNFASGLVIPRGRSVTVQILNGTAYHGTSFTLTSALTGHVRIDQTAQTWTNVAPSGTSPGGSSGQIQYNNSGSFGGLPGMSVTTNGVNGYVWQMPAQSTASVPDSLERNLAIARDDPAFPCNYYNDLTTTIGYNSNNAGIIDSTDPYGVGWQFETDYAHASSSTFTATSGTTTTVLQDSGRSYAVNGLIGYTLCNSTRNASAIITANTATSITVGTAIAGMVSGDSYQVFRRDTEDYFFENFGNVSTRPIFLSADKGHGIAAAQNPITITGATSANPIVFTTSAPHGLMTANNYATAANDLVSFSGLPGTFGSTLNSNEYAVTIVDSTHFSIPVSGVGFAAYTSGGTATIQPPLYDYIQPVPTTTNVGAQWTIPCWACGPASNNLVAQWQANGTFDFYSPGAYGITNSAVMNLRSGSSAASQIDIYAGNYAGGSVKTAELQGNGNQATLQLFSNGGSAAIIAQGIFGQTLQIGDTTYTAEVHKRPVQLAIFTVATLPTCNSTYQGAIAAVSDFTGTPTYAAALTGGGSTYQEAFCNGSTWTQH